MIEFVDVLCSCNSGTLISNYSVSQHRYSLCLWHQHQSGEWVMSRGVVCFKQSIVLNDQQWSGTTPPSLILIWGLHWEFHINEGRLCLCLWLLVCVCSWWSPHTLIWIYFLVVAYIISNLPCGKRPSKHSLCQKPFSNSKAHEHTHRHKEERSLSNLVVLLSQ